MLFLQGVVIWMKKFNGKIVALLVVVALVVGATASYFVTSMTMKRSQAVVNVDSTSQTSSEAKKINVIHDLIEKSYYKKVSSDKLYDGAIKGMIEALGDPFSSYMDAKTASSFNESLSSSFEGIGAEVQMVGDRVTIVSPIKGSPAEKAGLRPNDQILTINGKSTSGLSLDQAVNKIKGPSGTVVNLEVKRSGSSNVVTFKIKRGEIPLTTVNSKVIKNNQKSIGYIDITSFNENTDKEFIKSLNALEDKNIKGLIIDVRGNPGGYLQAVESIASQFITKDKPIVQVEDRNGKRDQFRSSLTKKKPYPIVTLIDEGSASASEILAGAMSEGGGYPLVGMKSFGKGTVQQGIEMSDKSEVKLTMFKWLTPDGNWIHKKGIQPDVKVKQPDYYFASPLNIKKGSVISYDQTGTNVTNLQKMLLGAGFDPGREDGYYSKSTDDAVRQFQKAKNLPVTGSVNQATADALQASVLKTISSGDHDEQLKAALRTLDKEIK